MKENASVMHFTEKQLRWSLAALKENSYVICFTEKELKLVLEALNFYSRQNMMFGQKCGRAARMEDELESFLLPSR